MQEIPHKLNNSLYLSAAPFKYQDIFCCQKLVYGVVKSATRTNPILQIPSKSRCYSFNQSSVQKVRQTKLQTKMEKNTKFLLLTSKLASQLKSVVIEWDPKTLRLFISSSQKSNRLTKYVQALGIPMLSLFLHFWRVGKPECEKLRRRKCKQCATLFLQPNYLYRWIHLPHSAAQKCSRRLRIC